MSSDRKACNIKKTSFLNGMKCAFIHFWTAHFDLCAWVAGLSLMQIEFWVINASIVVHWEGEERQRDVSEMKPSDRMFMRCQFVFGSEELTFACFGARLRDPFALFGSDPPRFSGVVMRCSGCRSNPQIWILLSDMAEHESAVKRFQPDTCAA